MNILPLRKSYQLKVVLNGIKPPIWRRIIVSNDITLDKLHNDLQFAMGWTNSHLHQFITTDGTCYGIIDDDLDMYDIQCHDEKSIRLGQILKVENEHLIYEYDFGDGWIHNIILEKITPYCELSLDKFCITGRRACPPEDCGGIDGYYNLLEILSNPHHKEYERMMEWTGGDYNPSYFSKDAVNNSKAFGILNYSSFDFIDDNEKDDIEFAISNAKVNAIKVVLEILLSELSNNHTEIFNKIKLESFTQAESIRVELGEIGEGDIEYYAYRLADEIEGYFE